LAVTPRWEYEDAYDNVENGDWYIGQTNDEAVLAWGESYVMMSLAAMYRATGHRMYLDRLATHLDGVLLQRDDQREVTDYRGVSAACWQTTAYQAEPYCYVVHSGMLIYPMADYVLLVEQAGLSEADVGDGETYGDKASRFLAAAEETVAAHEDQWDPAGFYRFRADADFLNYAGDDVPFNQSHAMGRALLVLFDVTQDPAYLEKATAMAQWFRSQMSDGGSGELLWNYWGGAYQGNGEDISHAAINVDFAALAAEHGAVFSEADVAKLAATFMENVYVAHTSYADFVGGGPLDNPSYRPQTGRWLRLTRARTSVYAGVRELYERDYPAAGVGSGSILLGWANLARYEPIARPHFFYSVDWQDLGDAQKATAYGANVLTVPPDLDAPCLVPLDAKVPRTTSVGQWDGDVYHQLAVWTPSEDFERHYLPYEPSWPLVYWQDGVLFQFADTFVAGEGIEVRQPLASELPLIVTTPPADPVYPQDLFEYAPDASGEIPLWWSLTQAPAQASIDPGSGTVHFSTPEIGSFEFVLTAQNAFGSDEQVFTVDVMGDDEGTGSTTGDPMTGSEASTEAATTQLTTGDPSEGSTSTDPETTGSSGGGVTGDSLPTDPGASGTGEMDGEEGCSCTQNRRRSLWGGLLGFGVLFLAWPRRRG